MMGKLLLLACGFILASAGDLITALLAYGFALLIFVTDERHGALDRGNEK